MIIEKFCKATSIFILVLILVTGCSSVANEDDEIIEIVKEVETAEYSIGRYRINIEEYYEILEGKFVENFPEQSHKDRVPGLIFNELFFPEPPTEEMLKELSEKNKEKVTVKISKVYYDKDKDWKIVYTNGVRLDETLPEGIHKRTINSKYTLVRENNQWKIAIIESFGYVEAQKLSEEQMKYNKFENKKVEYIVTLDLD